MSVARPLLAALLLAAIATVPDARAQSSLLDQGRNLLGSGVPGLGGGTAGASKLSAGEIGSGLREALKVGTERVVGTVGRPDGFLKNADIHIPLPETLHKVQSALKTVGASGMADDLEVRLNRAAEAAAPKARSLFAQAISEMTIEDANGILRGPKDAATQYLKGKMSNPLADSMRPIVNSSLADVGAIQSYDKMMGAYKAMPLVPDVKANLTDHVLHKALDGLFLLIGREEASIRDNPAQRSTELLRKVFGS